MSGTETAFKPWWNIKTSIKNKLVKNSCCWAESDSLLQVHPEPITVQSSPLLYGQWTTIPMSCFTKRLSSYIRGNWREQDILSLRVLVVHFIVNLSCLCVSRVWGQQTTTPQLLPTTPCWCSTTRAVVQPPALSARSTLPAQGTRTMTTSTTGALASRSWLTSTEEGTMTESGAGEGRVGLWQGSGEAGSVGWMPLKTTGRAHKHDAGFTVDMWGMDAYMCCVSLLTATKPTNMNSAATQLYSGFIFFSGEFVVWCFLFLFVVLSPCWTRSSPGTNQGGRERHE